MKKLLAVSLLAGLLSVACSSKPVETDSTIVPDMHTAEVSLDWNGTYEGVLPCASCGGIKTSLTLNKNKTYQLKETYITHKPGKDTFTEEGKFEFDKTNTSLIRLDEKADNRVFFVGEKTLEARDPTTGKAVDNAANYTLKKQ